MNFEKYITHKAINSNSVAKYSNSDNEMIKLVHVYDQDDLGELTMTVKEYDDMFDSIPEGNDTLAWILDNKFNCNMLKSDEDEYEEAHEQVNNE
ncbi:MAG: hypothetical protein GY829_10475 [Gammaproteobacteria bacterium]|nr:hypothetical protein [Gammaproteobacteria bacterium]